MKSFIAALIFALPALAQQLSMSGTVTNSKTGEPIARAMVSINGFIADAHEDAPETDVLKGETIRRSTFTDAGGRFQFNNLPEAEYTLNPQKPEFTLDFTQDDPPVDGYEIKLSSSANSVTLKLAPLGVITGTITDQDGLPVPGISVIGLASQITNGIRRIKSDRTVTTDDRGVYRFWNLGPGQYYVKTASRNSESEYVGNGTPGTGDESFFPVYYGGAHTIDAAAPIAITPGAEARADFVLNMEPAFRITGAIAGFTPHMAIKLDVMTGPNDVSGVHIAINSDTGKFVAGPVVPGSYLLRATQGTSTALAEVSMKSEDLTGVTLSLLPPVDIPLATHFTNSPPETPEGMIRRLANTDYVCRPSLQPLGQSTVAGFNARPTPNGGSPVIAAVPPGNYFVTFQCGGAYPGSARFGSQDLATNPVITISPGITPPPIETVATWGGGNINGTMKGTKQATIVVVPQFASPAGVQMSNAFPDPENPGAARFYFGSLAPGTYSAFAFAKPDIEFRNSEFLRTLSGGTSIQIGDGDQKELTISLVIP